MQVHICRLFLWIFCLVFIKVKEMIWWQFLSFFVCFSAGIGQTGTLSCFHWSKRNYLMKIFCLFVLVQGLVGQAPSLSSTFCWTRSRHMVRCGIIFSCLFCSAVTHVCFAYCSDATNVSFVTCWHIHFSSQEMTGRSVVCFDNICVPFPSLMICRAANHYTLGAINHAQVDGILLIRPWWNYHANTWK